MEWHREIVEKWRAAGVRMDEERDAASPRMLEGLPIVVTGSLRACPATRPRRRSRARRQGRRLGVEEDLVRGGRRAPGSKYDKAIQLKVPVLDEDGFRVLLAQGPPETPVD